MPGGSTNAERLCVALDLPEGTALSLVPGAALPLAPGEVCAADGGVLGGFGVASGLGVELLPRKRSSMLPPSTGGASEATSGGPLASAGVGVAAFSFGGAAAGGMFPSADIANETKLVLGVNTTSRTLRANGYDMHK